jgi:hypothetical protein
VGVYSKFTQEEGGCHFLCAHFPAYQPDNIHFPFSERIPFQKAIYKKRDFLTIINNHCGKIFITRQYLLNGFH